MARKWASDKAIEEVEQAPVEGCGAVEDSFEQEAFWRDGEQGVRSKCCHVAAGVFGRRGVASRVRFILSMSYGVSTESSRGA